MPDLATPAIPAAPQRLSGLEWTASVSLAIAMVLPTIIFFYQVTPYVQAATILFFAIPLYCLMRTQRLARQDLFKCVMVLLGITLPVWLSVFLNVAKYDFQAIQFAAVPIVATSVFIVTICVILAHPRSATILPRAMQAFAMIFAFFFIAISLLEPHWNWYRFNPGGVTAPQWWSEVLIAVLVGAAFFRNRALRYGFWTLAIVGIFLVQSRSAFATAVIFITFTSLHYESARRLGGVVVVALAFVVPLLLLVDSLLAREPLVFQAFQWLNETILLIDHPGRGLSSGITGRDDTWRAALAMLAEQPLSGVGFTRAHVYSFEQTGLTVHNGHLALLADLGIVLYSVLFVMMIGGMVRGLMRRDPVTCGYVIPYFFIAMMFKTVTLNMGVMQMLFWMMIAASWFRPTTVGSGLLSEAALAEEAAAADRTTAGRPALAARWRGLQHDGARPMTGSG